jgi:hypothetical protein
MKTILNALLLAGAATVLATGANAATVVYNFGLIADTAALTTDDLGLTATYTLSGLSVTASAFGPAGTAADHLYGKNLGGDETGLGMTNDPSGQHEIYFGKGFVQLDLNALLGKVQANSIFAAFNSTTGGEQWTIYGSNTAGVVGSATLPTTKTLIATGTNIESVNTLLTGGFRYYDFVSTVAAGGASGGNVLLKSLTVSVPEPDTWALMIVGFGGLGAMMRRRRAQVAAATA